MLTFSECSPGAALTEFSSLAYLGVCFFKRSDHFKVASPKTNRGTFVSFCLGLWLEQVFGWLGLTGVTHTCSHCTLRFIFTVVLTWQCQSTLCPAASPVPRCPAWLVLQALIIPPILRVDVLPGWGGGSFGCCRVVRPGGASCAVPSGSSPLLPSCR